MKHTKRPLDDVFISRDEIGQSLLRDVLIKYVKINEESMSVIPTLEYEKLKEKQKVLIYLLSRKALKLRDMVEHEHMTPTEISKTSGVKIGTVKPVVRKYFKDNLLKKNKNGYFIPDYALERVKKEVLES
jgi:DNA-binding MarR family transcriptional regulator